MYNNHSVKGYYQSRIPAHAEKVFQGIFFDVYQWPQQVFDGSTTTFEMAKKLDGVSVLAIKDDKIIMLEEEQPRRKPFWATPGGHMERSDNSPLEAAQRELCEETGMTFKTWKLVAIEYIGNTKLEWNAFRFVATDLISQAEARPEAGERIIVHELSYEDARNHSLENPFASQSVFARTHSLDDVLKLPDISPEL